MLDSAEAEHSEKLVDLCSSSARWRFSLEMEMTFPWLSGRCWASDRGSEPQPKHTQPERREDYLLTNWVVVLACGNPEFGHMRIGESWLVLAFGKPVVKQKRKKRAHQIKRSAGYEQINIAVPTATRRLREERMGQNLEGREVEQRVWCDGTGGKGLWESEQRKGGFSGNQTFSNSKKKRDASFG